MLVLWKIKIHNLFWFIFYEIISISRHMLLVW